MNARTICLSARLAAYAPAAIGVGGLSTVAFLISVTSHVRLLREQEEILRQAWTTREMMVVNDSPESFYLRHKHDKDFALIGQRRRRAEIAVTAFEDVPTFVLNVSLMVEEGIVGGTELTALIVACSNMFFKLWKMHRNYLDMKELQMRQSPEALQEQVARALEAKEFKHARMVMETNKTVPFVLAGAPSGVFNGKPVPRLPLRLSADEAAELFRACGAENAVMVALAVQIGDESGTADCEISKVFRFLLA